MVSEQRDMLPLPPAMQRRRNFETKDRSWSPAQSPVRDAEEKKKKRYLRISLRATVPGRNWCGVFTPPVAVEPRTSRPPARTRCGGVEPRTSSSPARTSSSPARTSSPSSPVEIFLRRGRPSDSQSHHCDRRQARKQIQSWSLRRWERGAPDLPCVSDSLLSLFVTESFFVEKEFVSFRAIRRRWGGSSEAQEQQQKSKASSEAEEQPLPKHRKSKASSEAQEQQQNSSIQQKSKALDPDVCFVPSASCAGFTRRRSWRVVTSMPWLRLVLPQLRLHLPYYYYGGREYYVGLCAGPSTACYCYICGRILPRVDRLHQQFTKPDDPFRWHQLCHVVCRLPAVPWDPRSPLSPHRRPASPRGTPLLDLGHPGSRRHLQDAEDGYSSNRRADAAHFPITGHLGWVGSYVWISIEYRADRRHLWGPVQDQAGGSISSGLLWVSSLASHPAGGASAIYDWHCDAATLSWGACRRSIPGRPWLSRQLSNTRPHLERPEPSDTWWDILDCLTCIYRYRLPGGSPIIDRVHRTLIFRASFPESWIRWWSRSGSRWSRTGPWAWRSTLPPLRALPAVWSSLWPLLGEVRETGPDGSRYHYDQHLLYSTGFAAHIPGRVWSPDDNPHTCRGFSVWRFSHLSSGLYVDIRYGSSCLSARALDHWLGGIRAHVRYPIPSFSPIPLA